MPARRAPSAEAAEGGAGAERARGRPEPVGPPWLQPLARSAGLCTFPHFMTQGILGESVKQFAENHFHSAALLRVCSFIALRERRSPAPVCLP